MPQIIVTEEQIMRNSVNMSEKDYKLPHFLYTQLKSKRTSLGDAECFPFERQYQYDYKLVKDRYKEIVDELATIKELESTDLTSVKNLCNKLIAECQDKEKPFIDYLNELCKRVVEKTLSVPKETVMFSCSLRGHIETEKPIRLMPEDDSNKNVYTFNDVKDIEQSNKSILKRRVLNSIIQGASYIMAYSSDEWKEEIYKLDESLPKLYNKIRILSDYILFNDEITYDEKNMNLSSYVAVNAKNHGKKSEIKSQAIIFPYLLMESFRGFFELFSIHGLPKDIEKAKHIINHADFKTAEPWDMRFGVNLFRNLFDGVSDELTPYYFSELSKMPTEKFNIILKEILSNTLRGKKEKEEIINVCQDYFDMVSDNELTNTDVDNIKTIISDETQNEYFTIEELKKMNADFI